MFLKNLLTLFSGTVLAQLIPLLALPILTRLYTPEDFGLYGIFIAFLTIGSVIFSLRYDFATAQAKDEESARNLLVFTFISALFFTITSLLALCFINLNFNIGNDSLIISFYSIIASAFLASMQALTYYLNRIGKFKRTSQLKVVQALVVTFLMLGLSGDFDYSLLISHVLGQVSFIAIAAIYLRKEIFNFSYLNVLSDAKEYKSYSYVGMPGALCNSFFLQLPTIFIKELYSSLILGYFSFINRYVSGPLSLLSVAMTQTLMSEVANRKYVRKTFYKVFYINVLISFLVIMGIYLVPSEIFDIVLGEGWSEIHFYLKVLVFSLVIRFVVSPLSSILTTKENVQLAFLWQVVSLCMLILFLILFYLHHQDKNFVDFLIYYVFLDVAVYLLYLAFIHKGLERHES